MHSFPTGLQTPAFSQLNQWPRLRLLGQTAARGDRQDRDPRREARSAVVVAISTAPGVGRKTEATNRPTRMVVSSGNGLTLVAVAFVGLVIH